MDAQPLVGVIMGSKSDWETMQAATDLLAHFGVPYEARVVSAHRTPAWMVEYATAAETRGLQVVIAGAAGRMGRALVEGVLKSDALELSAAFDVAASGAVGKDAGEWIGVQSGVSIGADAAVAFGDAGSGGFVPPRPFRLS